MMKINYLLRRRNGKIRKKEGDSNMAYRNGDRYQMGLFPKSIEDYVVGDDQVRAYDAFVEALDLEKLGIKWNENKIGNSEYNPKAMIKLFVYGYSYGIRSSRKLERATYHNMSFVWLMGGLKPDHKTIARFRRENKKALQNVLKQCVRLCIKLKLIDGNTLFVDGSKIRANASINQMWTEERCEKYLKKIDKHIEDILLENEAIDNQEEDKSSMVKLKEEVANKEALKERVQKIMKEIEHHKREAMNSTDPECVKVKGRQGTHAGYNGQIVVDEKHGLIVHGDVVDESNDQKQFTDQIEGANQNLGRKCETACADGGYSNTDNLKQIDDENIKVIVPSQKQAHNKEIKPFDKERFHYDENNDCYICPEGNQLKYSYFCRDKNNRIYHISKKSLCLACKHFGICTTSKDGRRIKRLANEDVKIKLEKQYKTEENQAIYKLRKQKVELPFGHIKRNLGVSAFLLKGLDGTKAEMSLFTSCFNIARMISIIGVPLLIEKLAS